MHYVHVRISITMRRTALHWRIVAAVAPSFQFTTLNYLHINKYIFSPVMEWLRGSWSSAAARMAHVFRCRAFVVRFSCHRATTTTTESAQFAYASENGSGIYLCVCMCLRVHCVCLVFTRISMKHTQTHTHRPVNAE